MSELPSVNETPISKTEDHQPETQRVVEVEQTMQNTSTKAEEEKVEVALPPILQPGPANHQVEATVASVPGNLINKGKTVSSLTTVALKTFSDLQRKLASHYQNLKQKVGIGG